MHLLHLLLSSTATLLRETVLARLSMPEFITPARSFKSEDFVYTTFIVPLYPLQDFDYITMKLENTDSRLQEILRLLLQLQLFHTLSLFHTHPYNITHVTKESRYFKRFLPTPTPILQRPYLAGEWRGAGYLDTWVLWRLILGL